ncbi:MAG: GWxTD domain-containing protein [Ignavibacteriaceae bacterium]|nr:GWxTD domain-containing protein [Ignavibacteriaceae bacterium]
MNIKLSAAILVTLGWFSVYAQPNDFENQNIGYRDKSFFTQVYPIPYTDSLILINFLYKIPHEKLFFSKEGEKYSTSILVSVEVSDSSSNYIERQFEVRSVTLNDFALTIDPNSYIEGNIKLKVQNRNLNIFAVVTDQTSQKEIFFREQYFKKILEDEFDLLPPILLERNSENCGVESKALVNFGNSIPFNNNSYQILFPIKDNLLESIFIKLISVKDTVFNGKVSRTELGLQKLYPCDGRMILKSVPDPDNLSLFYIDSLTYKLNEGPLELLISKREDFQKKKSFKYVVKWLKKPVSLKDPELAIRLLKFMISADSIKHLLKIGQHDLSLNNFWKTYDPSPETRYNELMAQYYERIDFAMENFSTISGQSGIDSDRAKIYVRFGKPNQVDRGSNGDGKVSETWTYSNKLRQKFIFVDEKGTGEFILKYTQ